MDPRFQLSVQDLIFAATALRAQARWSEQQAASPQYGSTREVFRSAAQGEDELARKFQRIADVLSQANR